MNGWRPIENVPKEGVYLIYEPGEDYPISVAQRSALGWYLVNFDPGYDLIQRDVNPTHWMELPDAPLV